MLLSGGFGGGVISDLHLLTPQPHAAGGGYRWVQPRVAGRFPVYRYGHTLTRCGPEGELAVLFGGLMAGGYQAPLDTIAVLRRTPGAADAEATAAASTAGAAAAAGAGPSQREEHTSLGLSLGRGAGGTWSQVLWAQMLRDHEEAEGYEEDEDEDEDEGDEEEGFESEEDVDAVMGSDDEMETEEEEGDEDEEWVPGGASAEHPASMPAHAVHAGVAPAMATGLASSGHALGEIMARLQDVAGEQGAAAAAAGQGQEQEWVAEGQYEWWYPEVGGEAPGARGYHSAAASEDGRQIWYFGGIAERGASSSLAVLDVATWQFSCPVTSGDPPPLRLGHSSCVHGGRLWVVGGGSGRDLLRSGRDLADVYCLDLGTMEWRRVPVSGSPPLCAGKCHASVLVGSRLLFFGGSMHTCNELAWLDLEARAWGRPQALLGAPPCERMSATAVLAGGGDVLVYGGYGFHSREMGDLHRLKLLPSGRELAAMEACGGGAAGPAARAVERFTCWRGFWR